MHQCVNVNIYTLLIFGLIFMKFQPKCKAKFLGMLYSLCWEVFAYFGIGKGPIFGPKIVFEKFLSKFSITKVKDY